MKTDELRAFSAAAPQNAEVSLSRGWQIARKVAAALSVAYLLTMLGIWWWMRLSGPESWPITFLLFGPRWLLALPLVVLVPLALVFRRRSLVALGVASYLLAVPILGFQPHFLTDHTPADVRVMTCNLDVQEYDVAKLTEVIEREHPDVVALQESKIMPPGIVWPEGWHFVHNDELIVASRWPIRQVEWSSRPHIPTKPVSVLCEIEMPHHKLQFVTLHMLTPRPGLEAVLNTRTGIDLSKVDELKKALFEQGEDSQAASSFIDRISGPLIVTGDFNMPVESGMYRRDWSRWKNAFNTAGLGFGFTKLTEEEGLTYGTRIDHILYTPPWRCVRSWLAAEVGSDHRPILADFVFDDGKN